MPILNPNSLKIGYVILVTTRKFAIEKFQREAGHKEGDYVFGKLAENVLPADFDNPELFEEVDARRDNA